MEIPVCYGGQFGEDLDEVAALHGMSPAQVIELHTSVTYLVYFLGFVPGFAYLGELPDALATPRLAVPRKSVPAGERGNRWQSDWRLPGRDAGRLEIDRPHSHGHVPAGPRRNECPFLRRSGAFCAHSGRSGLAEIART